jgi:hypothetical protein
MAPIWRGANHLSATVLYSISVVISVCMSDVTQVTQKQTTGTRESVREGEDECG